MAGRAAYRVCRSTSLAARIGALGLVILAAGCGGSQSTTATVQSATSSTNASGSLATTTSQTPPPVTASAALTTGPVRGRLTAPNHAPTVGRPWPYSVAVTSAAGKPLSGTVDIEYVFGGVVVGRDTPPTHPVKNGSWRDTLEFPADAAGQSLTFRAVVHTKLGSITLDWPITPEK